VIDRINPDGSRSFFKKVFAGRLLEE